MRSLVVALSFAAACLAATPVFAADPEDKTDPRVPARALAARGYALYDAGRYDEAIESLRQADALFHAPTLVFAMAKAHARSSRLRAARALLEAVVAEKLAADAPDAFRDAQARARTELAEMKDRIPTLGIAIQGGRAVKVIVDDTDVPEARRSEPIELDPGKHVIRVRPAAGAEITRTVDLEEHAKVRVLIDLQKRTTTESGAGAKLAPLDGKATAKPSKRPPFLAPALAAFGVGAVGVGVGIGTGIAAMGSWSKIKDTCAGADHQACNRLRPDFDTAQVLAGVSTAAFIVGGAALVTGVVLITVKPKSSAPPKVGIAIGPGSIGVTGVFQ